MQFKHPLVRIDRTLNRQTLGLATSVALNNYIRNVFKTSCKIIQITVGGLKYTGDLKCL